MDDKSAFFICFGMSGHDLPHPRRSLYAPQVDTPAPSAHGTTAQHRPCQLQGRPPTTDHTPTRTPGRWTRCTGLRPIPDRPRRVDRDGGGLEGVRSVSDRARPNGQNYCKQKYSFFMCKPLDKRNKIVYNIDSKQTYLHHHKTGGQNHEKDHRLYRIIRDHPRRTQRPPRSQRVG